MKKLVVICGAAALAAAACRRPLQPATSVPVAANDSVAAADPDSAARADAMRRAAEAAAAEAARRSAQEDSLRAAEQRATAAAADAMTALTATVYFDYDQSVLSDAARTLLDAKVPALKATPSLRIRVTGHTDERGSSEYNLALGLRRAAETKAYLVAQGVDAARIEIRSMGEEQPAVAGSNEQAWSRNRRAEFVPITGETDR